MTGHRGALTIAAVALLSTGTLAAEGAYYDPDDVAGRSARFAEAASAAAPAFEKVQQDLSRLGADLEDLELGVALLGSDAGDLASWALQTRRTALGQYLQIQRHVDLLQEDYSAVFSAAVDRSLARVAAGRDVQPCVRRGLGPMASGGSGRCAGEDIGPKIAAVVDEDAVLTAALGEIARVPWPAIELGSAPGPIVPLTGDERWVQVAPLARALAGDRLRAQAEALDDALADLEDGIDDGDKAAIAAAESTRAAWAAALGQDGSALRGALQAALQRAGGGAPARVGLCAVPPRLGGCPGEDVTRQVLDAVAGDRKLGRAIDKLKRSPLADLGGGAP